ncbi:hypothetical protein EZS27_004543 [termite gut metagenome]|uniref:Uncharacterized protein n=1 Tax=termite gut metagenome TaxID=433724 RepID=A0A5J4SPK7_9ZZZZ
MEIKKDGCNEWRRISSAGINCVFNLKFQLDASIK